MMALRKCKVIFVIFALAIVLAGGFTILTTKSADARPACCIWVMYCTVDPPIYCWEECRPVPCPK